MVTDEHQQHDRPCDCNPGSGSTKDSRKDERKSTVRRKRDQQPQMRLGFPRTLIAIILIANVSAVSMMILLGHTQQMGETETYLVVQVWSTLTTILGVMINAIFGVKEHHTDDEERK